MTDPKHIDAVAGALYDGASALANMNAEIDARRILASTDPAVHAAMLDALTRHGVLRYVATNADGSQVLLREPEVQP